MPCDSSHCEPSRREIELSRVLLLLDELDGKGQPDPRGSAWRGMDGRAYNCRDLEKRLDRKTAELCARLKHTTGLSEYSLELQAWWRDHQAADARKAKAAKEAAEHAERKERAELDRLKKKYGD